MEISLPGRDGETANAGSREVKTAEPSRGILLAGTRQTPERISRTKAAVADAAIDQALIHRFNAGDEAAFVEIVTRHRNRIHALALGFLRNYADAEEVAQDTFVRAHRGLARFRHESSLATWLHHITTNLARNRYWYFFRRRRHLSVSLDMPLGPESNGTLSDLVAAPECDPAHRATADDFVAIVANGMEKLEPSHREILNLRNRLHRSYDEIARSLGISEGTVKSRIARARGQLRRVIAEDHPELSAGETTSAWFERRREGSQHQAAA